MVVAVFRRIRDQHWPDDPRLPAPDSTLTTTAAQWIAQGGTVEAIEAHLVATMAKQHASGQGPPTSLSFVSRSIEGVIARCNAARTAPPGGSGGSGDRYEHQITDWLSRLRRTPIQTWRDEREDIWGRHPDDGINHSIPTEAVERWRAEQRSQATTTTAAAGAQA